MCRSWSLVRRRSASQWAHGLPAKEGLGLDEEGRPPVAVQEDLQDRLGPARHEGANPLFPSCLVCRGGWTGVDWVGVGVGEWGWIRVA